MNNKPILPIRKISLLSTLVKGLGFGLMYIPSVVVSAQFFTHNRALAIGICLCGSGFGTFTLAPLSQYILEHFGWRWVMRMLSMLSLIGALAGCSMIKASNCQNETCPPVHRRSRTRHVSGAKLLGLLVGDDVASSSSFICYLMFTLSDFLAFCAIYIPYTHLPPLAKVTKKP